MTKKSNKRPPVRSGKKSGLSKKAIMLIAMSVGLVLVVAALIVLLNVWKSKPENQPTPSEPTVEATVEESAEPTAEPEPEFTDVDFGSADYSKDFFSKDLFIGDSIAVGLSDYAKLDPSNVAASVSLTPYKAHAEAITLGDGSSGTALSYAEKMQPQRIFLMLGFNGLSSPNAMQGSFRDLMVKLEEACPDSVIYCCSITPLTADSSAAASAGFGNDNVRSFNEYLKTLSSELGVIYLDLNTHMSDDSGCLKQEYNEVDGMHLTSATYEYILSYIQRYITEAPEAEASSKAAGTLTPAVTTAPEDTSVPEETTSSEPEQSEPESTGLSESYDQEFFANDLFIGDSITTGLSLYGVLSPKNVAAAVGYTPYKAYNTEIALGDGSTGTAFDYAVKMQPKRIFIMLGSNGITTASAMEDSYRTLLDKLAKKCPDSTVYVLAVTPVTDDSTSASYAGITNTMITDFNKFIKSLADEKGLTYIDMYSLLSDDNGYFLHEYAESDGLHFKGATYKVMLSYIESLI